MAPPSWLGEAGVGPEGGTDAVIAKLAERDYVAPRPLATVVYLALSMGKPLLLEGEAGVGKTEVARALSEALGCGLIRLQCYEGLDISAAAYEWDHPRQLMEIRIAEAEGRAEGLAGRLYSEEYLLKRPLLRALETPAGSRPPVLLIDELDRADEPFEAYLLEFLADFQMTIPEHGPVRAEVAPVAVITSNRTREIHDALKRRCLYHWVDFPDAEQEREILRRRAEVPLEGLRAQMVAFVHELRGLDLYKIPGVAETIDWANALMSLNRRALDREAVDRTLGALLKYRDDLDKIRGDQIDAILEKIAADG